MPYYHGGRMDKDLKRAIESFFFQNYEMKMGYAEDFVNELEEYLTKKGFDLECVTQFNEEYLEKFREEQNEKTD